MEIRIRAEEASLPERTTSPDLVWQPDLGYADLVMAGPTGADLQSLHSLHTAFVIALFTDRRAEPYELDGQTDPHGWWGDSVDLDDGEQPIGSKLWLLRREVLNDATAARAKAYAIDALRPFIDNNVVAQFNVTAVPDIPNGRLDLGVQAFSQAGAKIYDQRFAYLWNQEFGATATTPAPTQEIVPFLVDTGGGVFEPFQVLTDPIGPTFNDFDVVV